MVRLADNEDLVWNIPCEMWNHMDQFSMVDNTTYDKDFAYVDMAECAARYTAENKYSTVPIDIHVVDLELCEK